MREPIDCAGAPRDLGLDQGRACRPALRAGFSALGGWESLRVRFGPREADATRTARDLRRHFPHQAETLEGIARAAGVPRRWLERTLSRSFDVRAWSARQPVAALAPPHFGPQPLLLRGIEAGALLRLRRPEAGLHSVELVLPWLSAPLAGVNQEGLAVAFAGRGAPAAGSEWGSPAVLLLADCLQRFDCVEAAVDWCLARPARGNCSLLLADAAGRTAAVEIEAEQRRLRDPARGLLLEAASRELAGPLAQRLRGCGRSGAAELAAALVGDAPALVLDPAGRRLGCFGCGPSARWHRAQG